MVDLCLEVEVDILRRYVTGSATVLDVGAGTGALTIPLSEAGYHVVAADGSKEMLSQLEKHSRAATLGPGGGLKPKKLTCSIFHGSVKSLTGRYPAGCCLILKTT